MKKESCGVSNCSAAFLLKIFLTSAGRVAVTEGDDLGGLGVIPQQAFCRCNPAKIAKHVYVCIACQFVKTAYEYN